MGRWWLASWVACAGAGCAGSGWDGTHPSTDPTDTPPPPISGTTGETGIPTSPLPGILVINEVLARPPTGLGGDASCDGIADPEADGFVELVNVSGGAVNVGGAEVWVDGSLRYTFLSGIVLQPLGAAVVFGGPGAHLDGLGTSGPWCAALPPTVVVVGAEGGLGLTEGAVMVRDADGNLLDEFTGGTDADTSYNRTPDLVAGSTPIAHGQVSGARGAFSPGTLVTGVPFTGPVTTTTETGDTGITGTVTTGDTGPVGPLLTDLYAVQDGTVLTGAEVTVDGVIVTAVATDGVMVEEPAGGPYSGLFVALGAGWETTWGALAEGDVVSVTGVVQEVDANTVIDPALSASPAVAKTGTAALPAPAAITAGALAADPEAYEGVLVEFGQGVVFALPGGGDIEVRDPGGASSALVDDQLWLYTGIGSLAVGERLKFARGVVFGHATGLPRVSPRADDDLAELPVALRINEVMGDPPSLLGDTNCDGVVDGVQDDFVEIWNLGGDAIDVGGMTLSDTVPSVIARHTFPSLVVPPGGGVVVFGGGSPTFDGSSLAGTWCAALPASVSVTTASSGALGITNSGDTLVLSSLGIVADEVTFGAEAAQDASVNRSPELSTQPPVRHDTVAGASNRWSPGTLVNAVPPPFRATVTVDGDPSDFPAGAVFTSSASTAIDVAWDATNLYVAVEHPAIGRGPEESVVLYVGDGSGVGAADGLALGAQQPALPFAATRAVVWATDGSSDTFAQWDDLAGTWDETPSWLGTVGSAVVDDDLGEVVEFALPLVELGAASVLELAVAIVDTTPFAEQTVCALPSAAIVDGAFDPNLASYYEFHPQLDDLPNSYVPVP